MVAVKKAALIVKGHLNVTALTLALKSVVMESLVLVRCELFIIMILY